MIRIITLNVDDKVIDWYFESKEEIEKNWWKQCWLPANDDPVIYVEIDGERVHIPNDMIFLNFLEMIEIDMQIE